MKKYNLHLMPIPLLAILLFLFSSPISAEELIILSMNTEFFFDHEAPHGQVVGSSSNNPIPTEQEWKAEAKVIAKKIDSTYSEMKNVDNYVD